jgi:hypothetical protein
MFVSVTTDEEDHKKVLDFFGVDLSETPTYRLAKGREHFAAMRKFNNQHFNKISVFVI